MSNREDICERLIESLQEIIVILDRMREECAADNWGLIPPDDLEEIQEKILELIERIGGQNED